MAAQTCRPGSFCRPVYQRLTMRAGRCSTFDDITPSFRGRKAEPGTHAATIGESEGTMRVETRFATTAAGTTSSARRAQGTAFTLGGEPARAAAGSTAAASLTGLDAILTLQAEEDAPQERRRRSLKRGHDLLDGLDRLKAALLGGRVSASDLQAVAGRLSERASTSGDPRLDGLVAEIELRAAVELAKLEART